MRNLALLAALLLVPTAAVAQDDDPFAPTTPTSTPPARSTPRASSSASGGPWRAGFGFNSGLGVVNNNLTLDPGLALIAEYCFGGGVCATGSGAIVAATGRAQFGNVVVQNDGFDIDLSGGVRVPFTSGPTEVSGFGVLQLGLSDPGGAVLTELGMFFGLAIEQQVWNQIYLRLSSSIVGVQTAFQGNASGFALLVTFNPAGAVVVHF